MADKNSVHPLYKIIAVIVVGSVAKALFSERPVVTPTVVNQAFDTARDTASHLVEVKGK